VKTEAVKKKTKKLRTIKISEIIHGQLKAAAALQGRKLTPMVESMLLDSMHRDFKGVLGLRIKQPHNV